MHIHANFLDSRLRGNDHDGAYISLSVIPAKAGIQELRPRLIEMLRK